MAISKISTKGMSGDTLDAGDIAPNAIGASELADNAVGVAAIASNAITVAKLSADIAAGSVIPTGVIPHIQTKTLHPAYRGLLIDNTAYEFTDSSPSAHTITSGGGAYHQGGRKKVGSTSLFFDGTNDKLEIVDHADWDLGSGDYTIEFWLNDASMVDGDGIIGNQTSSGYSGWLIRRASGELNFNHWPSSGSTAEVNFSTSSAGIGSSNTWRHIAFVKTGTAYKFYINGVNNGSVTDNSSLTVSGSPLKIGVNFASAFSNCYIDELRITKGVAVYTGNFAAPTIALTTTWSAGTNIAANSTAANVKLLIHSDNGGHSGAYGTAQSDGKSYYYTDINGSKPIKDPRIGSHFGSSRHRTSSVQKLEQETATHGSPVYSVDGRSWIRMANQVHATSQAGNDGNGNYVRIMDTLGTMEITGYFSDLNIQILTTANRTVRYELDGDSEVSTNYGTVAQNTPLADRFVNAGSSVNIPINTTLGIHTVRIRRNGSAVIQIYNVELIAQDVSSTANRSKVQIPSQNVVSFGKKFTVSGTPHYDPFNGFTSGNLAAVQALVDTATSLGVEGWKNSSTYYRPYNGGRVVRWVDSTGALKTSVNMMPPNARSIANSASLTNGVAKANASIANNTFYPTFEAAGIDSSQAEVAKTFLWREFGNGNANGGATGTYKDASMLDATARDIAYVMDDGLTSLSAKTMSTGTLASAAGGQIMNFTTGDIGYFTFIGTGVTLAITNWDGNANQIITVAQNLPYGTHILRIALNASPTKLQVHVDGIEMWNNDTTAWAPSEITIYQPKMPPIPEDAIIISDYMLMADFVKQTDAEDSEISKGVRYNSGSRDHFYAGTAASQAIVHHASRSGVTGGHSSSSAVSPWKLPFFGTTGLALCEGSGDAHTIKLGGISATKTALDSNSGSVPARNDAMSIGSVVALGQTSIETTLLAGGYAFYGHYVASPIHTSSHYQSFETPFLHELVGGDRNMEQTNLVVTPDGKTWDQVTRDVSYIGDMALQLHSSTTAIDNNALVIMDECRGYITGGKYTNQGNKDFAIAYDRQICLRDGEYEFHMGSMYENAGNQHEGVFLVNGNKIGNIYVEESTWTNGLISGIIHLKRGDYVQIKGGYWNNNEAYFSEYYIRRLS